MTRIETILMIVLIFIFIIYASLMSYLMYNLYLTSRNGSARGESKAESGVSGKNLLDVNSPFHTDFFNQSSTLASEVLFGRSMTREYGDPNYYGSKLVDVIGKINDDTKKSILVAIKYMGIEPVAARENEKIFRSAAESEGVPIWFVILREAVRKVVPEFMLDQSSDRKDNIVPLYKTG